MMEPELAVENKKRRRAEQKTERREMEGWRAVLESLPHGGAYTGVRTPRSALMRSACSVLPDTARRERCYKYLAAVSKQGARKPRDRKAGHTRQQDPGTEVPDGEASVSLHEKERLRAGRTLQAQQLGRTRHARST